MDIKKQEEIVNRLINITELDEDNAIINEISELFSEITGKPKPESLELDDENPIFYSTMKELMSTLTSTLNPVLEEKLYIEIDTEFYEYLDNDNLKLQRLAKTTNEYDMYDIICSLQNDKNKIDALDNLTDDFHKKDVILSLKSDKSKIDALDKLTDDSDKKDVILSLKSDKSKIDALDLLSYYKANVILSLKSDISKIDALDKLTDDSDKKDVILSLKSDKSKIDVLDKLTGNSYRKDVILSLKSDISKIDALDKLTDDFYKKDVILSLKSDISKIDVLDFLDNSQYKKDVILSLKSDISKLTVLNDPDKAKLLDDYIRKKIVSSLKSDKSKIDALDFLDNSHDKTGVILSLKSDISKLTVLNDPDKAKLLNDYYKKEIISSLKSDKSKIDALDFIDNYSCKADVILSLQYDKNKLITLQTLNSQSNQENPFLDYDKRKIILSMKKDKSKIDALDLVDDYSTRVDIISSLQYDKNKLITLQTLNSQSNQENPFLDYDKRKIILSMKKDKSKIDALDLVDDYSNKIEIILSLQNDESKLTVLNKLNTDSLQIYRYLETNIEFLNKNIKTFIELEGYLDKEDYILEKLSSIFQINYETYNTVNFGIIDEKFFSMLGEDKIAQIVCYPEIQDMIISLNDNQLKILSSCLNNYLDNNKTEEWTVITQNILQNIGQYDKLIDSIDDTEKIDIEKLTSIIQDENTFNIESVDDLARYGEIKEQKCNEIISNPESSIEEIQSATIQKVFGHSAKYAHELIEKYGDDIEQIKDEDTKGHILALKGIFDCRDLDTLKTIYAECENIEVTDKVFIERCLKSEYGKLFNEGLYIPTEEQCIGENIFEAGTDFKMIITSIGAYSDNDHNLEENGYYEDWNRPALASQHFCASYIRNDMLGTAPIKSICYGFTDMADDSLMLSGSTDICSTRSGFVSKADDRTTDKEIYYSPDNQINKTEFYNEMDFRRIQNGKKKQPDYIVVFKEDGKIPYMDNALKASEEFGGIPIVVIDKDKCLESERSKVDEMLEKYAETQDPELAKKITQKVHNNRVTSFEFCKDIDEQLEPIKETAKSISDKLTQKSKDYTVPEIITQGAKQETIEITSSKTSHIQSEDKKVGIASLEQNYESVTPEERKSEVSKMTRIINKIKEITRKDQEEIG